VKRILLIEQKVEAGFDFGKKLNDLGYEICIVNDAFQALVHLESHSFDLVLVDLAIPKMDSFWLLMARKCHTPVITLANTNDVLEKLNAFEMGADDYLSKPFNIRELQLRMNVIKRRGKLTENAIRQTIIEFDDTEYSLTCSGHKITLTNTEYRLFKYLYERQGEVVTKEELQQRVLHKKLGKFDRNLDMHISNTRRKLADRNLSRDLINTVRGQGYSFNF